MLQEGGQAAPHGLPIPIIDPGQKELLAMVGSFKERWHYLEGKPNHLEVTVYTNHLDLKSFMTTKQLAQF